MQSEWLSGAIVRLCVPPQADLFEIHTLEAIRRVCLKSAAGGHLDFILLDVSSACIFGAGFVGLLMLSHRELALKRCELLVEGATGSCADVLSVVQCARTISLLSKRGNSGRTDIVDVDWGLVEISRRQQIRQDRLFATNEAQDHRKDALFG